MAALTLNNWAEVTWFPTDCDTEVTFPAIAADQDCFLAPPLSQISDIYLTFITDPAAAEPFTWTSGVPAANAGGIDNTDATNAFSKQLTVVGGLAEPELLEVTGPKRQTAIVEWTYTLTAQMEILDNANREFLRYFQANYLNWKFWFATVGGNLFGPEAGIRPSRVSVTFPLDSAEDGREVANLEIQYKSTKGDVVRNANPYA